MEEIIYLQLEDGTCYTGKSFGAPLKDDVTAEVVFTTAMTSYIETLTDPSYHGQMIVHTFPLLGNYGVNTADYESQNIHMSAYITKEYCKFPSNFRQEFDLDTFLKEEGVPGIYDIDTRSLTKHIRKHGAMNGRLTRTCPSVIPETLKKYTTSNAISSVTCSEIYEVPSGLPKYHIILWDFGTKKNIIRKLHSLGCHVTVVPSGTTADEIIALRPDGVMLSNGPGNPKDNTGIVEELSKVCKMHIPIFGICMGHQLLALANGADTEKLKYGHRGANQPVLDLKDYKIYITSQNHGYTVKTNTLPEDAILRFYNLNDNTCEGIEYPSIPAFSAQFHPEACGGPHDTDFLFREFISLMERSKSNA